MSDVVDMSSENKKGIQAINMLGELTIDTRPLDEILVNLSTTVRQHATLMANLPALESNQSELRKGLRKIELALSSKNNIASDGIVDCDDHLKPKRQSDDVLGCCAQEESKESRSTKISIQRLKAVKTAVRHSNESLEHANVQALRCNLAGLSAIVAQVQNEHHIEIAHSTEIENRIDGLSSELSDLHQELGSHANISEVVSSTQAINKKIDDMNCVIKDIHQNFKLEICGTVNKKIVEMKKWFKNLEALVKGRQSNLNAMIALLAKDTDLSALIENIKHEFVDVKVRINVVEESVINNEEVILTIKQQAAFATFSKCHKRWKQIMLDEAWLKWHSLHKAQQETTKIITSRKKRVRKILVRHWFGRKHKAWEIWCRFVENHRQAEIKKERVTKFIYSRMYRAITVPTHHAFKRWRRTFIADKVTESNKLRRISILRSSRCEHNVGPGEIKTDKHKIKANTDIHITKYELVNLLDMFNNDPEGAIYTLSQEINNIRNHDIIKLQRDFNIGQEALLVKIEASLSTGMLSIEKRASKLENNDDEKFTELKNENTVMRTQISELRNSLYGTVNRVKNIEKSHGERLEQLCEEKEVVDEKVLKLQSQQDHARIKIKNLEYNNDRSQNISNVLFQRLNDNERVHNELAQSFESNVSSLKGELGSIAKSLHVSNEKYSKLKDDYIGARNELIQSKISSKDKFDEIHDVLHTYGVCKPDLNRIINDEILYEKNAKEKNYVGAIKCIFDGSNGVDIPGNIASFAYNYAAWIAYEVDNEIIRIVVEGNKTEDGINAEDNMAERRQDLIDV